MSEADRLQAVAKARIIIKSLGWRKPSSVGIEDADDKEFKCAVIEFIESPDNLPLNVVFKQTPIILSIDADAAWREKQDGGECPECKNYIGHCPACHRDLPTKLPSECPYCGGSGHREDAEEYIRRMGPPAQEMPATQPPSALEGDVERVALGEKLKAMADRWVIKLDNTELLPMIYKAAEALLSPAPQQARSEDEAILARAMYEIDPFTNKDEIIPWSEITPYWHGKYIGQARKLQSALAAKR